MKRFISIFSFIAALCILLYLGTWQLKRLAWKTDIIQQLDVEYQNKDNLILTIPVLEEASQNKKLKYGSIEGTFDHSKEINIGPKTHDGKVGYSVITPLKINTTNHTILVNRGWISQEDSEDLKQSKTKGKVRVTGLFRAPTWNKFTPGNSPENNIWQRLDIEQIADAKQIKNIIPIMLYAEKSSQDFGSIIMQEEQWKPRNKHKQYAIFWFGMTGVLIIIFGLYNLKERKNRPQ